MRVQRVCPICNRCGSKKFKILEKKFKKQDDQNENIVIQCLSCDKILNI